MWAKENQDKLFIDCATQVVSLVIVLHAQQCVAGPSGWPKDGILILQTLHFLSATLSMLWVLQSLQCVGEEPWFPNLACLLLHTLHFLRTFGLALLATAWSPSLSEAPEGS